MSETDLTVAAEFEFEAVEAGVVKDVTCRESVESETRTVSVEANNVLSTEFNCTAFQEARTDTNGDKCNEQKKMEEPIKILQEKNQCPKH